MLPIVVGANVPAPLPLSAETTVAVAVSVVPSAVIVTPELSVVVTVSSCVSPLPEFELPPPLDPPPEPPPPLDPPPELCCRQYPP